MLGSNDWGEPLPLAERAQDAALSTQRKVTAMVKENIALLSKQLRENHAEMLTQIDAIKSALNGRHERIGQKIYILLGKHRDDMSPASVTAFQDLAEEILDNAS
jgi:S-adenosylmethionine:tRNA-ribosyltransferase-isomerase (queuine synthetase)